MMLQKFLFLLALAQLSRSNTVRCKKCDGVFVEDTATDIAKLMFSSAFSVTQYCDTAPLIDCAGSCTQTQRSLRLVWNDGSYDDAVGTLTTLQCGADQPTCAIYSNPEFNIYPDSSSLTGITMELDHCEDLMDDDIPRSALGLPDDSTDSEGETDSESETDTESETDPETDSETDVETDSGVDTDSESETDETSGESGYEVEDEDEFKVKDPNSTSISQLSSLILFTSFLFTNISFLLR